MSTASPERVEIEGAPGKGRGPARFLADILTAGNAACGVAAIHLALVPFYLAAGGFLLLAMLFDALDGAAARRFGSWHSKGHLVDTAADLVTMAAAPAVLVWSAIADVAPELAMLGLAAAIVYATCAVARLVNFAARGFKQKHFSGLPSPGGLLMVMLLVFLLGPTPFLVQSPLVLGLAVVFLSPLMVAPFLYPKIRGRVVLPLTVAGAAVGAPAICVFLATCLASCSYEPLVVKAGAVLALVYFLGYAASGPVATAFNLGKGTGARAT
jgi:CDP-diacylglycerol--serine O-phosphatidyltransferase